MIALIGAVARDRMNCYYSDEFNPSLIYYCALLRP